MDGKQEVGPRLTRVSTGPAVLRGRYKTLMTATLCEKADSAVLLRSLALLVCSGEGEVSLFMFSSGLIL